MVPENNFLKNSCNRRQDQDRDWPIVAHITFDTCFEIGATLASLQTSGKIAVSREVLNILAKDFQTNEQVICSIKLKILSLLHEFFAFICMIARITSSSVTFQNRNRFDVTCDVTVFGCWVSEVTLSLNILLRFLLHAKSTLSIL